jgi:phosphonopyruvate decarboxylase
MTADKLNEILNFSGIDFFCGVPDSLLKPFCDVIYSKYANDSANHLITHNEGGAVGYAAGYYLATGKVPCVYLQNSGIGNITNPVMSLTSPLVYGIPVFYLVGWRGQPGIADEPQHAFQGIVTEVQLEALGISVFKLTELTTEKELAQAMENFKSLFADGKSAALIVSKDALTKGIPQNYSNNWTLSRETVITRIAEMAKDAIIVSSTGKISRELFETRERLNLKHDHDFLTVGSMGHDSMIALSIAQQQPNKQVWSIQGDGAFLMHMGAAAMIGSIAPNNLRHIVLNNAAHESVGGMPTVGASVNFCGIAQSCGYKHVFRIETINEIDNAINKMIAVNELCFLEIRCAIGSRQNLGRPAVSPIENKEALIKTIKI